MAHLKKIPLVEDRTENRLWAKAEAGSRAGRPGLMAAAWTGCSSGGADMMDVGWRKKGAGGDAEVSGTSNTKDGDTIH